jgi:ubiquinone/menaquinone biosynthesis C-methylase UbiE
VLNIGGQGEVAYAIDVNNLISPTMDPAQFIRPGRFILGDAAALPVRAGVADEVTGNRSPAGDDDFRGAVAAEALRVLRPGGRFHIWSVSGGGHIWLPA